MDGTFIKENHDLLEGFHEVDVVIAVFLNLLQEDKLWLALGTEHGQQGSVLLEQSRGKRCVTWSQHSWNLNSALKAPFAVSMLCPIRVNFIPVYTLVTVPTKETKYDCITNNYTTLGIYWELWNWNHIFTGYGAGQLYHEDGGKLSLPRVPGTASHLKDLFLLFLSPRYLWLSVSARELFLRPTHFPFVEMFPSGTVFLPLTSQTLKIVIHGHLGHNLTSTS